MTYTNTGKTMSYGRPVCKIKWYPVVLLTSGLYNIVCHYDGSTQSYLNHSYYTVDYHLG